MSDLGGSATPASSHEWEVEVGELVIGRGWSWKPAPLHNSAVKDYLNKTSINGGVPPTHYSISTFGLRRKAGETMDELVERLFAHMREQRVRAKYVALVTATELSAAGFDLQLSEPPPDHYDLPLGWHPDELRTEELGRVFDVRERRRMPG